MSGTRWTEQQLKDFEARQARYKKNVPADAVEIESELHAQIFAECKRRGWVAFHGSMAHETHRTEGEPDFIIARPDSILFVECKSKTGKLSLPQLAIIAHMAKLGHTVHVVRSFSEFLALL